MFWIKPQTPIERLAYLRRLIGMAGERYVDDVQRAEQRFIGTVGPLYEELAALRREAGEVIDELR